MSIRPPSSAGPGLALAAFLLAAGAVGARAQTQQQTPPPLPRENDLVRVVDHPDEGMLEFVIGPAAVKVGGPHLRFPIQMTRIPVDGWLHGFQWEITDAQGNKEPDDLLHHVNFIDPDHRELFAPIPRRMLAAGRETLKQEMPRILGYPVEKGTRVLISAMFASPHDHDYSGLYLHVKVYYTPKGKGFIEPRDVYPFYVDVMGPVGPKSFAVPPGHTEKSWEGKPAIDGRILAIGGHMHDYATQMRFEDVTTGEVLWKTAPDTVGGGHVVDVPTGQMWWKGGIKIYKDHTYRVVVDYDNPLDHAAPDMGMGALGGILWASKGVQWPALDRSSPMYVADLTNTLTAPERLGGEHMHMGNR